MLALAALLGAAQRQRRGERADDAGVVQRHVAGVLEWLVVDVARGDHRAAHRVEREVGDLVVAVRPVLPEVRHRGQHDARVHLAQRVVAEAEPLHRARREALDHRVRAGDEAEQAVAVLGAFEVEHDAALVGVEEEEDGGALGAGLVLVERGLHPRRIAARRLDLDHVRAVVAEQASREGSGLALRKVDHGHIVERHHVGHGGHLHAAVYETGARVRRRRPRLQRPDQRREDCRCATGPKSGIVSLRPRGVVRGRAESYEPASGREGVGAARRGRCSSVALPGQAQRFPPAGRAASWQGRSSSGG